MRRGEYCIGGPHPAASLLMALLKCRPSLNVKTLNELEIGYKP